MYGGWIMSGKIDGDKQGTVSGTCPTGGEQGPSVPHCGQCSAGGAADAVREGFRKDTFLPCAYGARTVACGSVDSLYVPSGGSGVRDLVPELLEEDAGTRGNEGVAVHVRCNERDGPGFGPGEIEDSAD